ncbi:hypothetical protein SAY87_020928 [Trapa incisa]|uniref:TF-B3 domain-containing protein n=1 Tax=Trapa incisa TaxID=236973 RepID=A0AAN7JQI5_9MYRT|nr:hypothetical protein SAY87_020928 [Trapa incisa]
MAGVESKMSYEECRRQRLEENRKRMEELNLTKLASNLSQGTNKSTPVKGSKQRAPRQQSALSSAPARRSSRVANLPAPNYKEVIDLSEGGRVRRGHSRRDLSNRVYASDEARAYATERADHLQSELEGGFPSFVKPMLQSHVTGGFWLGLPLHFCRKHMPPGDEMFTLVDEAGEEHLAKYLGKKNGLSGGWRGFAIDHDLVDGDAVVFQLIKPTVFKVHIIRAYESEGEQEPEENAKEELGVSHLDRSAKRGRASKKK